MSAESALRSLFGIVGKTAVVTGGGRGIGEMIAKTYVKHGAKVYIASRNAKALQATADALTKTGPGTCIALPADLSNEEGCLSFAKQFSEREEKCHILVNNSGIAWGAAFNEFPAAQFDRVFALNVKTLFVLTRAFMPYLKKASAPGDPARVINIGSITGIIPQPVPTYSYDISKAAVHHLTKKLSAEFAPTITFNAIAPGFVPSRMSKGLETFMSAEDMAKAVPMGRWGSEEDMGGAAVYLASKAGAWVTGQTFVIDGGQTSKPLNMLPNMQEEM